MTASRPGPRRLILAPDGSGSPSPSPFHVTDPASQKASHALARPAWLVSGLLLVGLGGLGVVVPGLPTTIFFIGAAACFARSSPRLEQWVLDLPHIGPMVRDYRSGLGMPRKAKIAAIVTIALAVTLSALLIPSWLVRGIAIGTAIVGMVYIALRVPTRETVLAQRTGPDAAP